MKFNVLLLTVLCLLHCKPQPQKAPLPAVKLTNNADAVVPEDTTPPTVIDSIPESAWQVYAATHDFYMGKDYYQTQNIGPYTFTGYWNSNLPHKNDAYTGGLDSLVVQHKNGAKQTLTGLEDAILLDRIYFELFEYNMDGYLDLSYPLSSGRSQWPQYMLYHPNTKHFELDTTWNYVRYLRYAKAYQVFQTTPDSGGLHTYYDYYRVADGQLELIKKEHLTH